MVKKRLLRWLAVASAKVKDAYISKSYTWRMVMVPKPTMEAPFPCILVSIRNGHSKLFFRVRNLEDYYAAFKLSAEDEIKINEALVEANLEADKVEEDMKILYQKRHLAPGTQIVNTGTGEVLAQADWILKDSQEGNDG